MIQASSERAALSADLYYPASAGNVPRQEIPYRVEFENGASRVCGAGPPAFVLEVAGERQLLRLLRADAYSLATGFLRGDFNIRGDLIAAVRRLRPAAGPSGERG